MLIRPVTIAEIERTAREGLLMPPKSTFFTPKLRTGLVLRDLVLSPSEYVVRTGRSTALGRHQYSTGQPRVPMLFSSAKACLRRSTKDSSPRRSQARGSYCFLFGWSGPLGLPI